MVIRQDSFDKFKKFISNRKEMNAYKTFYEYHGCVPTSSDIKKIGNDYYWRYGSIDEIVYSINNKKSIQAGGWIHEFSSSPTIWVGSDNKTIQITGGKLKVKEDGIHG